MNTGRRIILGKKAAVGAGSPVGVPTSILASSAVFDTENQVGSARDSFQRQPRRAAYQTTELVPGVRLQVADGVVCEWADVGTPECPVWIITPGQRTGVLREDVETGAVTHSYDATGVLPLLLMAAAKPIARVVSRRLSDMDDADDHPRAQEPRSSPPDLSGALLIDTDNKRVLT